MGFSETISALIAVFLEKCQCQPDIVPNLKGALALAPYQLPASSVLKAQMEQPILANLLSIRNNLCKMRKEEELMHPLPKANPL